MTQELSLDGQGAELGTITDRESDDILFTSASFEDRSTIVSQNLADNYEAEFGFIYVNKELVNEFAPEKTQTTIDILYNNIKDKCKNVSVICGSYFNPVDQVNALKSTIAEVESCFEIESVTIDVSTFNREVLMILLSLIRSRHLNSNVRILYTQPEKYGNWLSMGNREVRNVIGFTGLHRTDRPTALIVQSGFETDRVLGIIEEMEPKRVVLGWGDEPTKSEFKKRNKQQQEKIANRLETEEFAFSATDIHQCSNDIEAKINDYASTHNVVLAPMSTKLATIGCWQAARRHIDTQVIYALPSTYNFENYSEGYASIYSDSLQMNFN